MFIALQVIPRERGLWKRFRERLNPAKSDLSYCAVSGGAPFMILKIKEDKNGIDWEKVKFHTCGCYDKLLIPENTVPPQEAEIKKYEPKLLPSVCIFNNAKEILKKVNLPQKVELVVFDIKGVYSKLIDDVFAYAANVWVVTANENEYYRAAERIMEKYGATLLINQNVSPEGKIVIADEYDREKIKGAQIVFTPRCDFVFDGLVTGDGIWLEDQYETICPPGIDRFAFACALYEFSALRMMEKKRFERLFFNGREITDSTLAGEIGKRL